MKDIEKDEDGYFIDEDGTAYDNEYDLLVIGKLNFCGCVSSEIINDTLNVLKELSNWPKVNLYYSSIARRLNLDQKYVELILCYLDGLEIDLIEHGTAIRGSWLSPNGRKLIWKFRKYFRIH